MNSFTFELKNRAQRNSVYTSKYGNKALGSSGYKRVIVNGRTTVQQQPNDLKLKH